MKGKVIDSILMFLIITLVFSFPVAEAGSRRGQNAATTVQNAATAQNVATVQNAGEEQAAGTVQDAGAVQVTVTGAGGAGTIIPREALMSVPPGVKNRKAPVPFPHAKHKGMDCTVCHHNAYETLLMSKCSAKGCHFDTNKREGVESYFATFHSIFEKSDRSCVDCHKTRGKGPTSCKDCHQQR